MSGGEPGCRLPSGSLALDSVSKVVGLGSRVKLDCGRCGTQNSETNLTLIEHSLYTAALKLLARKVLESCVRTVCGHPLFIAENQRLI